MYFALSDSVEVTDEAEDEGGEEDEECRGPRARSGSGSHLESASRILLSANRRETYHRALNDLDRSFRPQVFGDNSYLSEPK